MSEEFTAAEVERSQTASLVNRRNFLGASAGGLGMGLGVSSVGDARDIRKGPDIHPALFTFVGGRSGSWSVVSAEAVVGEPLPAAERLDIIIGTAPASSDRAAWLLRGVTSNVRYTTRGEMDLLVAKQAGLGRSDATRAALIPIRKNAEWWSLTQDQRRTIFEDQSHHIKTGLRYLPAIARRLLHCRDLGESEPFDFLTWFDYAEADSAAFEELVNELRTTEEWKYVEREVDIRLVQVGAC